MLVLLIKFNNTRNQINHDQYKQDNINFLSSLLVSTVISLNSTVVFYFQITDISVTKTAN